MTLRPARVKMTAPVIITTCPTSAGGNCACARSPLCKVKRQCNFAQLAKARTRRAAEHNQNLEVWWALCETSPPEPQPVAQNLLCQWRELGAAGRSELVAISLFLALTLCCLDTNLFVILLQRSQVLAGLRELTFLHALSDVPVNEGTLGVHQIELVVDARKHLCDGRGVADHAHRAHDLSKISAEHHRGRLVVDAALEARGRPVHELDRALRLDR